MMHQRAVKVANRSWANRLTERFTLNNYLVAVACDNQIRTLIPFTTDMLYPKTSFSQKRCQMFLKLHSRELLPKRTFLRRLEQCCSEFTSVPQNV